MQVSGLTCIWTQGRLRAFSPPSDTSTWAIAPVHLLRGHVHVPVTARVRVASRSTSLVTRERRGDAGRLIGGPSAVLPARIVRPSGQECLTNDRGLASARGAEPVQRGVVSVQHGLLVGEDHGVVA